MRKSLFLLVSVLLVSLCSCSVLEQLDINGTHGGTSATVLEADDFFVDVLNDFAEFSDPKDPTKALDTAVDEFATSLKKSGGAEDITFIKTDDRNYLGTFSYDDIEYLLARLGAGDNQDILTLKGNTLSFHLSLDNYPQLEEVVPFLKDENFQPFGPKYNKGMSAEDYYDMVAFMLGDEAPQAIKNSRIVLILKTPGVIVESENGTLLDEKTFRFSFPLIDFLLLSKPIDSSVTWK